MDVQQQGQIYYFKMKSDKIEFTLKNTSIGKRHNEASEKSNKEDIKNEEKNIPPAVKKEKKVFETIDCEIEKFLSKTNLNYYSDYNTNEKLILESFKNPSLNVDLNQTLSSDSKEWFVKETKIEKDTKESLKAKYGTNVLNPHKRKQASENDSEEEINIHNKNKPLIELLRPVLKSEEPEIRIVKKMYRKDRVLVDVERGPNERCITFTPSTRELIDQLKSATLPLNENRHNIFIENQKSEDGDTKVTESSFEGAERTDHGSVEVLQERDIQQAPEEPITSLSMNIVIPNEEAREDSVEVFNELGTEHDIQQPKTSSMNMVTTNERSKENAAEVFNEQGVHQYNTLEPSTSSLSMDSTLGIDKTAEKVIKVKAPQALGIQSEDVSQVSQNVCSRNLLNHFNQIRFNSGNESRIAEICYLYPIHFTSEVRSDISELVQTLYTLSGQFICEQENPTQSHGTFLLNLQNCSKEFIKIFHRILKLDQIGSDQLKKIIPILYLHIYKSFQKLNPDEDFDFRIIMRKIFNTESFVCEHDVMLEKDSEVFKKIISTFDRWLDELFTECDLSNILKPETTVVPKDGQTDHSLSLSSEESSEQIDKNHIDTYEQQIEISENLSFSSDESTSASESNSLEESEESIETSESIKTQRSTKLGEFNYLLCRLCLEDLPSCIICKEPLSCPCDLQDDPIQVFDRGPTSLNFCIEHSVCADNWTEWEEEWKKEEMKDHDMPYDPVCWNGSCENKAMWLCICRMQGYCSLTCQDEDWSNGHYLSCPKQSDPRCYYYPEQEDLDMS